MNSTERTITHNRAFLNVMRERQAKAVTTGADCPTCGGGVNPTILARFGHCLSCQRKAAGI